MLVPSHRRFNRVLLMTPRYTLYKRDVRRCVTPIGLAYIAAMLEKNGYEVKILDVEAEGYCNTKEEDDFVTYGLNDKEIKKCIFEFKPNIVGVSCIFTSQSNNVKEALKLIKSVSRDIITITGGSHPTFALEEMLINENLDYIIMGEGELSTLALLNAFNDGSDISEICGVAFRKNGKVFVNRNLQYVSDINELPFPATHFLNMERYFEINIPQNPYPIGKRVIQVITSRGCPAKCIFCTTTNFWGNRYRGRSAESVIEEIKTQKEKYNIDEVQFTDDNLTLNKKRAMDILDGIKDMGIVWCAPQGIAVWALDVELLVKMKESGCYQLTFAIESGSQYVLDNIIKKPLNLEKVKPLVNKAQELGIKVHAFCVCGLPYETIIQMQETYDFVKDCGFDSASFFAANPLVGSELLSICQEKGFLKGELKPQDRLFKIGNITTPDFTALEIQNLVEVFNAEYNKKDLRQKKFEKDKY